LREVYSSEKQAMSKRFEISGEALRNPALYMNGKQVIASIEKHFSEKKKKKSAVKKNQASA